MEWQQGLNFTPSPPPSALVQTGQVGPTFQHLLRPWLLRCTVALSVHPAVDAHSTLCGLCVCVCVHVSSSPPAWGRAGVQEELMSVLHTA